MDLKNDIGKIIFSRNLKITFGNLFYVWDNNWFFINIFSPTQYQGASDHIVQTLFLRGSTNHEIAEEQDQNRQDLGKITPICTAKADTVSFHINYDHPTNHFARRCAATR